MTHGDSYEEALIHAQEVLELLIEDAIEDKVALPSPMAFIDRASFNNSPDSFLEATAECGFQASNLR